MAPKSKILIYVGFLILLIGVTLGACSQVSIGEEAGTSQLEVPAALVEPTDVPIEAAQALVEPETTDLMASEEVAISDCLVCHTDKQMLIDTAKPEEEVVSESEGEG